MATENPNLPAPEERVSDAAEDVQTVTSEVTSEVPETEASAAAEAEPVVETPAAEEPETEKSVAGTPAAEVPVAEAPAAEEPVAEPEAAPRAKRARIKPVAEAVETESGEEAGRNAAAWCGAKQRRVDINIGGEFLYLVPQQIDLESDNSKTVVYFRSKKVLDKSVLRLKIDGEEVWKKTYPFLRPPEMQQLTLDMTKYDINENSDVRFEIEVVK